MDETPQPITAPQAPVTPPTAPATAPQRPATPGNGPNKKLIILIASIVGGLLIVGVVLLVLFLTVFAGPTKKDYIDAVSQYSDVISKANASVSDINGFSYLSSSSTETKAKNDIEEARKSLEAFKTEDAKFKDLKAFRNSEVKEKYDAYKKQAEAYITYAGNLITSYEKVYAVFSECSDSLSSATDSAAVTAKLNACVDSLKEVKDIPDADLKKYVGVATETFEKLNSIYAEVVALKDPYGDDYTRYKELRTELTDATSAASDAQTDYSSSATKHAKEASPRDAGNALGDILEEKARG